MEGKGKIVVGIIAVLLACFIINRCNSGNDTEVSSGASNIVQSSSQQKTTVPLTDEELMELSEIESKSGLIRGVLSRFTVYAASKGIELIEFEKKNDLNNYFTDLLASKEKIDQNAYYINSESAFFQEDYFVVSDLIVDSPYPGSYFFYLGEINSQNRPHGKGMIGIIRCAAIGDENPTRLITYIGEFKDGRKNGYGIQFYIPDSYYTCRAAEHKAIEMLSKEDIYVDDEKYTAKYREFYTMLLEGMLNIPIYEGEFKNNYFSGKGNYSSPYVSLVDELSLNTINDSETDRSIDSEIFSSYFDKKDAFMMDVGLYVGTFDKSKPVNAKCYEFGKLSHDGKWKDFSDPIA